MTAPMEDRQNPNLVIANDVIDSVKLKPMERRTAHVREPYSRMERGIGQCPHRAIDFIEKIFA